MSKASLSLSPVVFSENEIFRVEKQTNKQTPKKSLCYLYMYIYVTKIHLTLISHNNVYYRISGNWISTIHTSK